MKLIVQIPCFNEAESIARVIDSVPKVIEGIDVIETLVIDDGSSDATVAMRLWRCDCGDATVAMAWSAGANYVVRHDHSLGLAAAFMTGLGACLERGADIVVNTDGDHQYPGRYVDDLARPILDGRAEIVVGDRQPSSDRRLRFMKRFLHRIGSFAVGMLSGRRLADPVSGFRAYRNVAARECQVCNKFSYTIESLMRAAYSRTRIEFVRIETNETTRPSRLFRSNLQFVRRSAIVAIGLAYHQRVSVLKALIKRVST